MPIHAADIATVLSGSAVGFILALVGGGGSILAVPLLVYGVGVASPHVAIGTSAIAVAISALANMIAHWRAGNVRWPCAIVFSLAGVAGAFAGAGVAKQLDGQNLLILFGILMIVIGALMLKKRAGGGDPSIRLTATTARQLMPMLVGTGFAVGLLAGFFGIGGGFLIVPGLMLATGMPLIYRHRHLAGRRRRLWRFDRDQLRIVRAGRLATGRSVHRGRPAGRTGRDRNGQIDRLARQGIAIGLRRHRHSRRRLRLRARGAAASVNEMADPTTKAKRAARRAALFSSSISLEPTPPRASGPARRRGLRRRPGLRTWQSSSGTCRPAHARSCRTRPCPSRC